MAIKVAMFHDNPSLANSLALMLRHKGFEVAKFVKFSDVKKLSKTDERVKADVAIIHIGFDVCSRGGKITCDAAQIINGTLDSNTRRILVGGHLADNVTKRAIELESDHYFCILDTTREFFFSVLNLGKITEEEKNLRGVSVGGKEGVRAEKEMGLTPDRGGDDERLYWKRAKERGNE